MPTYLVRVRLADRPGALGAVASRIGAVQGDVTGVEILERIGDHAVDEFVVELPNERLVELLVSEIEQVDGSAVEHVRRLPGQPRRRLDAAYDAALSLVRQPSSQCLLAELAAVARRELDAEWTAVVDVDCDGGGVLYGEGRAPARSWLVACAAGLRAAPREGPAPEIAGALLVNFDLALLSGRPGWPFRPVERLRLATLADLADARWLDLARRSDLARRADLALRADAARRPDLARRRPHPAGGAAAAGRNESGSVP